MATVESQSQVERAVPPPPQTATTLPPIPIPPKVATQPAPPASAPAAPAAPAALAAPAAPLVAAPAQHMIDKIGLNFTVKTFKPDGTSESITIPLPDSLDFLQWTFAQQVGMLKNGVWKDQSLQDIIFGLAYAKHIGAEVLEGELFPTGNGRWGTSNKYKIKKGFSTGKVLGYTTDIVDTGKPLPDAIKAKCIQQTDLECTVILDVKGLTKPVVRKAKLSRWFTAANPNWSSRPEHMLELNTLAHAMEYLVPGETDEAPPTPFDGQGSSAASIPTVEELKRQRISAGSGKVTPQPQPVAPVIEAGNALPDPTEISGILDSLVPEETQPVGFTSENRTGRL
jgi:hypothetical protein